MNIGDLVKDVWLDLMGLIVDFEYDEDNDEMLAVVQLLDTTKVLCSHEDIELVACSEIGGYDENR
jgi:hypothetical protein